MIQFANKKYYTKWYPGKKMHNKEKTKNVRTTWKQTAPWKKKKLA